VLHVRCPAAPAFGPGPRARRGALSIADCLSQKSSHQGYVGINAGVARGGWAFLRWGLGWRVVFEHNGLLLHRAGKGLVLTMPSFCKNHARIPMNWLQVLLIVL